MARGSSIGGMSVADLQREISRRQRKVGALERRRAKLMKKVAELDSEIARNGGSGRRGGSMSGRTRARNSMSLVEAMAQTLKGKTMGVTELAEAVQKNGYVTTSPNFRTIVNQALIKFKKQFKRIERGQYTAA